MLLGTSALTSRSLNQFDVRGLFVDEIVSSLIQVINSGSTSMDVIENSVSSLGKFLDVFDYEKLSNGPFGLWLSHLPLKNDGEEAKFTTRQLVNLVKAKSPSVMTKSEEVKRIFNWVLANPIVDEMDMCDADVLSSIRAM
jgi:hypothetical protein